MDFAEIMEYVVIILTGVATAIPLIVKLVQYIKKSAQEKNWNNMLRLLLVLMEDAEELLEDGASRKEYVMAAVDNLAEAVDYEISKEELSELIDRLCLMSKKVNAPVEDSADE